MPMATKKNDKQLQQIMARAFEEQNGRDGERIMQSIRDMISGKSDLVGFEIPQTIDGISYYLTGHKDNDTIIIKIREVR
jgi:hypothetical protein